MTEFQFAFLCIFALSIVIMMAYTLHKDRQDETTVWTTTVTNDTQEEKEMPISYAIPEFDTISQTAFEFARAYSRIACLAAEQMSIDGAIPQESKKNQAVSILRSFITAQGHDPDEEYLAVTIPYLIDASIREDAKPLF